MESGDQIKSTPSLDKIPCKKAPSFTEFFLPSCHTVPVHSSQVITPPLFTGRGSGPSSEDESSRYSSVSDSTSEDDETTAAHRAMVAAIGQGGKKLIIDPMDYDTGKVVGDSTEWIEMAKIPSIREYKHKVITLQPSMAAYNAGDLQPDSDTDTVDKAMINPPDPYMSGFSYEDLNKKEPPFSVIWNQADSKYEPEPTCCLVDCCSLFKGQLKI